jgi:hypothetical protein
VADGDALDPLDRPDQLGEVGQGAAELAAEDLDQRVALRRAGVVVDQQDKLRRIRFLFGRTT